MKPGAKITRGTSLYQPMTALPAATPGPKCFGDLYREAMAAAGLVGWPDDPHRHQMAETHHSALVETWAERKARRAAEKLALSPPVPAEPSRKPTRRPAAVNGHALKPEGRADTPRTRKAHQRASKRLKRNRCADQTKKNSRCSVNVADVSMKEKGGPFGPPYIRRRVRTGAHVGNTGDASRCKTVMT